MGAFFSLSKQFASLISIPYAVIAFDAAISDLLLTPV